MTNQMAKIREHLRKHRSITSWDAIQLYGCTRLSDKIFQLRNKGWIIDTQMIDVKNRYGDETQIAKYIMRKGGK